MTINEVYPKHRQYWMVRAYSLKADFYRNSGKTGVLMKLKVTRQNLINALADVQEQIETLEGWDD